MVVQQQTLKSEYQPPELMGCFFLPLPVLGMDERRSSSTPLVIMVVLAVLPMEGVLFRWSNEGTVVTGGSMVFRFRRFLLLLLSLAVDSVALLEEGDVLDGADDDDVVGVLLDGT